MLLDFTGDKSDKIPALNGIIENESIGDNPEGADDNEWLWAYTVFCRHYMGPGDGADYPLEGPFTVEFPTDPSDRL
jgi:hypothetical protein